MGGGGGGHVDCGQSGGGRPLLGAWLSVVAACPAEPGFCGRSNGTAVAAVTALSAAVTSEAERLQLKALAPRYRVLLGNWRPLPSPQRPAPI